MKKLILSVTLVTVMLFSGCATILQSGPDRIPINTNPAGAQVFLDDQPVGYTPLILQVPRDSDGRIRLEKEGYNTVTINRDKVLAGWFLGNVLIGGVIGIGVDLIAHNQGKHSEEPIYAAMAPTVAPGAGVATNPAPAERVPAAKK